MNWTLNITKSARKELARLPAKDQEHILVALGELEKNPFSGDVVRLRQGPSAWRRRVGSYRLFFDIYPATHVVVVSEIARRTSTTY